MMKKIIFLTLLLVLFCTSMVLSQKLDIEIVKKIGYREVFYSNILYPLTIKGCRFFLNDIKSIHPDIYTELNPLVSKIEMNNIIAWSSLIGGAIIGTGLSSYGIFNSLYSLNSDNMTM